MQCSADTVRSEDKGSPRARITFRSPERFLLTLLPPSPFLAPGSPRFRLRLVSSWPTRFVLLNLTWTWVCLGLPALASLFSIRDLSLDNFDDDRVRSALLETHVDNRS